VAAKGTHFVISAGRTDSGAPTYLCENGEWSPDLQQAFAMVDAAERDERLARALKQERLVSDPYFFEVAIENGVIDPLTARERIRANGPTTRIRRPD
jgi:hypothetical protein